MDKVVSKISNVSKLLMEISDEWDNFGHDEDEKMCDAYPFRKDFQEVIMDFVKWKKNIEQN